MPSEDNSTQTIFEAIKYGKIEDLEGNVRQGALINQVEKTRDKFTPLHTAAFYGSLECLHWLLWQNADATVTTPKGWTPLMIAAIRGHYPCIQALIKNGVNINATDRRGQTAAHLSATHGHSHTLQAILRGGADVSIQDNNGWTPVHSAAYHGRLGCLQFLKTALGKLDEYDNDGNTPAHLAAMEGNLPCLKYILSNSMNMNTLISARNDQGDSPKTLAQQFFKDHVTEYLEAIEWDRDHPEQAENLAFPAHVAAFNGDLDHIKLLVDQGVININERDDKGASIAHKAAGQGHIHVIQWLIDNGADLKIANQTGELPLDVAKRFAQLACIKLLQTETADDSNENTYYRENTHDSNTESKEPLLLSNQQKRDAKSRARKRLEDIEKQVLIARSNYLQLGGKLEDVLPDETRNEHAVMKNINELQNQLEFERIKREKLEVQLDSTHQELERHVRTVRDYETKVLVLEKYIHHTSKSNDSGTPGKGKKITKPKLPTTGTVSSSMKNKGLKKEESSAGFVVRSNSRTSNRSANLDRPSSSRPTSSRASRKANLSNLTSSQMNELKHAFDEIDSNNSGYLSRKELRQAFRNLDIRVSDDEIDVVMRQMDSDSNGKVDFDEFASVMGKTYYRKRTRDEIVEAFRKFDLNNSGSISPEELRVVLSKMHRFYTREETEDLIRQVDRNRDGMITIEEFVDLMNLPTMRSSGIRSGSGKKSGLSKLNSNQLNELRRAFEEIDINQSGGISKRELRQAFHYLDIKASDDEIDVVMDQMDTDDSGRIEFDEFASVMAKTYYKKHSRYEIIEAFKVFDLNGSGSITPEELRSVLSKMHRFYNKNEVEDMIRRVDHNRDGMITIDEFVELMDL